MYQNERKEGFNFKSFFLTLLMILLFVFLMLFLFPTKWDLKKIQNSGNNLQSTSDIEKLSVLYDEIFANNVMRMKYAAIGYFTTERLPKEVGQSRRLTLQDMYDLHLVLKMKDKNGKACSVKKSYVSMTKFEDEYHLKVNLSCGEDEDYIIVYLGCYSYCNKGICEKEVKKTEKVEAKKTVVVPPTNPTPVVKYYCKVVNGNYYDANGNKVSKSEYEKSCYTPSTKKYYCKVVNGKYYDANGNKVSKSEYEKSCSSPKYYCRVVDGKYYDKNGNKVSKSEYEKSCKDTKKIYEYKLTKEGSTTCSVWSSWQKKEIKATDTVKVETKTEKEITGYETKKVKIGVKKKTITKNVAEKYVAGYTTKLVAVGTKKVQVGSTTKTTYSTVAAGTVSTYAGIGSGTSVPADTSTTTYKVVSTDKSRSCSYCATETIYTYEIYRLETVYKTVESTVEVPVYQNVTVYEKKQVPVYESKVVPKKEVIEEPIYKEEKVPVYSDIKYYRSKTCNTTEGTTTYKWSYSYPDKDLESKGYKFTGNVKEV